MRCLTCHLFSFQIICKGCQEKFLTPSFYKRTIENELDVYFFYPFAEVKELLSSKYEFYGDKVYTLLAKLAFKKFAQNFSYEEKITVISVDDHTRHDFSQTAILGKHLQTSQLFPLYGVLQAQNKVKYAGKNLAFRQQNKRDFSYTGPSNIQVILVDDVVTTGTTLIEAKRILEDHGCEVLFALTITDANS